LCWEENTFLPPNVDAKEARARFLESCFNKSSTAAYAMFSEYPVRMNMKVAENLLQADLMQKKESSRGTDGTKDNYAKALTMALVQDFIDVIYGCLV
jgi:hypothetical protein